MSSRFSSPNHQATVREAMSVQRKRNQMPSMCTCKSCDHVLKSGYSLPIGYTAVTGNRFPCLASHSHSHYLQIKYHPIELSFQFVIRGGKVTRKIGIFYRKEHGDKPWMTKVKTLTKGEMQTWSRTSWRWWPLSIYIYIYPNKYHIQYKVSTASNQ